MPRRDHPVRPGCDAAPRRNTIVLVSLASVSSTRIRRDRRAGRNPSKVKPVGGEPGYAERRGDRTRPRHAVHRNIMRACFSHQNVSRIAHERRSGITDQRKAPPLQQPGEDPAGSPRARCARGRPGSGSESRTVSNSTLVRRVSSASTVSTSRNTVHARPERSSRFPIGVATTYSTPCVSCVAKSGVSTADTAQAQCNVAGNGRRSGMASVDGTE